MEKEVAALDSKAESKAVLAAATAQIRAKCPCLCNRLVSDEGLYVGPGQYAPVWGAKLLCNSLSD